MAFAARVGAFLVALLVLPGCGDSSGMSEVSGNVKLDGQPVEAGTIMFIPSDGKSQTTGGEIKGGRYSVRVPVGPMKVSISSPKVTGKKKIYPTPQSPEMPITVEAVPHRYNENTELTLDVKAGSNKKDFDLPGK